LLHDALEGCRNTIGQTQSSTGKTATFVIHCLQRIDFKHKACHGFAVLLACAASVAVIEISNALRAQCQIASSGGFIMCDETPRQSNLVLMNDSPCLVVVVGVVFAAVEPPCRRAWPLATSGAAAKNGWGVFAMG